MFRYLKVAFANNPITGFLILISLYIAEPVIALAAVVSCTIAIITALTYEEESLITNGLTTYNALLVGAVTASLLRPLYGLEISQEVWIYIVVGAIMRYENHAIMNTDNK